MKPMKWLVGIAVVVLVLAASCFGIVYALTEPRLARKYDIAAETVVIPTDAAGLARGRHVAIISGCVDCHGENLAGRVFSEKAMIGRFVGSNLTAGKGGVGARFTHQDWIRAIRHGVRPNGKPLLVMPSKEYFPLSDADLGALLAYLKSIPAVDHELPASAVSLMGRILMLFIKDMALLAAERIDHQAVRPAAPVVGISPQYGAYLAVRCTGCHGDTLSGGKIPGTPPDWPPALNLTPYPGASTDVWSQDEFIRTLRTGITPRGNQLDTRYMPWKVLGQMTDDELKALWLFLRSAPPKEYGNR